jgi:hypothetical protein
MWFVASLIAVARFGQKPMPTVPSRRQLDVPVIALILNVLGTAVQRTAKDIVLVLTSGPYIHGLVGAVPAPLYAAWDVPSIRCALTDACNYKVPR